jgi:hypothetical protein
MNPKEAKYEKFALVQEMLETIQVVEKFDANVTQNVARNIKSKGRLLLAGEGSSRCWRVRGRAVCFRPKISHDKRVVPAPASA